jgi:hypothetical protein
MVRTTIFWLATPSEHRLPVNPLSFQKSLELGGKRLDVDDLALEHKASGKCPYGHWSTGSALARAS